ncbi:MAG: hypothetical protein AB4426_13865 [Xenococcaceae cyanobacterium]
MFTLYHMGLITHNSIDGGKILQSPLLRAQSSPSSSDGVERRRGGFNCRPTCNDVP